MIRIFLILLAMLCMGTPVSAKNKKAPKSQLKSFSYILGGGMEISHQNEVSLRLTRDGKRLLSYLKSLRGDRQAFGHLTSTYYNDPTKIPNLNTTVWTDGIIEYVPDEGGFKELIGYLNARYGMDNESAYWITKYVEGCGMRCLLLEDPYERLLEIFVDKSTLDVTLEGADTHSSRWPQAYQRMLTKGELERIPTDSLLMLEKEVSHSYDTHTSVRNDLERQNTELIIRYTERRMNEERKSKSE